MVQLVTISGMASISAHSGPASSGLRFCNVAARWQESLSRPRYVFFSIPSGHHPLTPIARDLPPISGLGPPVAIKLLCPFFFFKNARAQAVSQPFSVCRPYDQPSPPNRTFFRSRNREPLRRFISAFHVAQ
jgi:hypothetical protein